MEIPRIYFGHPINCYDVPLEIELIKIIEREFPTFQVENPNRPHHQEGYRRYSRQGRGMDYFFQEVLPGMAAGVFLPFEDGMFGAGVWGEAEFLHRQAKPIYEISVEGTIGNMVFDLARKLPVEETRARVYHKNKQ